MVSFALYPLGFSDEILCESFVPPKLYIELRLST
jgi:hypothetical protein